MPRYLPLKQTIILILTSLLLASCTEKQAPVAEPETPAAEANLNSELQAKASLLAWHLGHSQLQQLHTEVLSFQKSIAALIDNPNAETLSQAQAHWHQSHQRYLKTAAFLAIGESNPGLFAHLQDLSFKLDAWPIQPGYLDSFGVYRHSGIVNDITVKLNANTIRQQHGFSSDEDVILGFHGIEYLLWGEGGTRSPTDLSPVSARPEGMAQDIPLADHPQNRRRVLLTLQAQLLVDDMQLLAQHWGFPKSLLQQQYLALAPASRFTLFRQATAHLLQNRLQPQFEQAGITNTNTNIDSTNSTTYTEPEPQHNVYAGKNLESARSIIAGIQTLFSDPDLKPWLLPRDKDNTWLNTLAEIDQELAKGPKDITTQVEQLLNQTELP